MTTGIYKITNLVNGKVYIGASKNIERRWRDHKKRINSPIHSDLEALGVENFKFEVLLECPEDMLCQWERDMICLYDSDDPEKGYNNPKDRPYSLKNSENMKGKNRYPRTDYQKQRVSESHKGIPQSDETKRKISEALKGRPSPRKGRPGTPLSEEHKRKISEARKGIPHSEEQKEKQSEKMKVIWQKRKKTYEFIFYISSTSNN